MNQLLNTLNEREKWMVIATLLCLVLYAYYLFLYGPLSHHVQQKSTQLTEKVSTLEWMKKVRHQNSKAPSKKIIDNSQLLSVLATQLKQEFAAFPFQLQQTGSGDIQLTFEAVPFNSFIAWLDKLNQNYNLSLKQFNAERSATPGIVQILVLISAAS